MSREVSTEILQDVETVVANLPAIFNINGLLEAEYESELTCLVSDSVSSKVVFDLT